MATQFQDTEGIIHDGAGGIEHLDTTGVRNEQAAAPAAGVDSIYVHGQQPMMGGGYGILTHGTP